MELYRVTTRNAEGFEYGRLFLSQEKALEKAEELANIQCLHYLYQWIVVEKLKHDPNAFFDEFPHDETLAKWEFGKKVSVEV